jgi:hypothetical protein
MGRASVVIGWFLRRPRRARRRRGRRAVRSRSAHRSAAIRPPPRGVPARAGRSEIRPSIRRRTSLARSSTLTCLDAAANVILNGAASSPMFCSRFASRRSMARRVGSARAWKTRESQPIGLMNTVGCKIIKPRGAKCRRGIDPSHSPCMVGVWLPRPSRSRPMPLNFALCLGAESAEQDGS